MSEEKLIKKAIKGDRYAQNELYKQFYSYIYTVSARYGGNTEEREEITHDAFIRAFANLDKFDAKQHFKPWLRKITVNVAIDYYRKYQSTPKNLEILETDANEENDALNNLAAEEILALIAKLSPAYRIAFSLFVVEGFSHQEIAEKLEISVGTSKSNLSKAKAHLREMASSFLGLSKKLLNE